MANKAKGKKTKKAGKKVSKSKAKVASKKVKSTKPKKKVAAKTAKSSKSSKTKGKKGKKGGSWGPKGPKPVDPHGGGKKKPPKKIKKKWPPKKKKVKGTTTDPPVSSNLLQFGDFAQHVETIFTITNLSPNVDIELIEITALPELDIPEEVAMEVRTEPFTLLFLAPPNVTIEQGSYDVSHPAMGDLTMFLTPVGEPYNDGSGPQLTLECVYS